jgi:hypothetical protein
MGKLDPKLAEFKDAYDISSDEMWEVRRGGAWAIKHVALERVAAQQGITFEVPQFAEKDSANGIVAMMVVGHLKDRSEWSMGEAAPSNNKNAYPYAMAEKRAKDRVILKLLNTTGAPLYSDEESEDFKRPSIVTKPEDIGPEVEYDEHGHPIDNIPLGEEGIVRMSKANSRAEYAALEAAMFEISDETKLEKWGEANKNRIATLHTEWQTILRGRYSEHRDSLRKGRAA